MTFTTSTTENRWSPPTLVNPKTHAIATTGSVSITEDGNQDVIYTQAAPRAQISGINIFGGRHHRWIGGDINSSRINASQLTGSFFLEGVRGDFATVETDFLQMAGLTGIAEADLPNIYVQCVHGRNIRGRFHNLDSTGLTGRAVTNTSFSSPTTTITLASAPTDWTAGVTLVRLSLNGGAYRATHTVASISGSTITVTSSAIPTGATGTAWGFISVGGKHSDGLQVQYDAANPTPVGALCFDRVTFDINYQGLISGHTNDGNGSRSAYLYRCNTKWNTIEPQEDNSIAWFIGDAGNATQIALPAARVLAHPYDMLGVYAQLRSGKGLDTDTVFPNKNALRDTTAVGATTSDMGATCTWPDPPMGVTGVVTAGDPPGGDWAPWGTPGNTVPGVGYVSPGYYDYTTPAAPNDITLTSQTVAENVAVGTVVGWLGIDASGPGQIVDITLTNDAGGRFVLDYGALKTNAVLDYETNSSHTITLLATVRNSSPALTLSQNKTITVTDVNDPAFDFFGRLTAAGYTPTTGEQTAYTTFINGLVSDGIFAKLTALYTFGLMATNATDTEKAGKQNLISGSFTLNKAGSMTFVAPSGGVSGYVVMDGVAGSHLDTGIVPNTNLQLNSVSLGCYIKNNAQSDAFDLGNGNLRLISRNSFGKAGGRLNDGTSATANNSDSSGFWAGVREDSTTKKYYRNTTLLSNTSTSSTSLPSSNQLIGENGGDAVSSNHQYQLAFWGSALTSTDISNFITRFSNLKSGLSLS